MVSTSEPVGSSACQFYSIKVQSSSLYVTRYLRFFKCEVFNVVIINKILNVDDLECIPDVVNTNFPFTSGLEELEIQNELELRILRYLVAYEQ